MPIYTCVCTHNVYVMAPKHYYHNLVLLMVIGCVLSGALKIKLMFLFKN